MQTPPKPPRLTFARLLGELCAAADDAWNRTDYTTLRTFALTMAAYSTTALHAKLMGIARACTEDPRRALSLWASSRVELFRAIVDEHPARHRSPSAAVARTLARVAALFAASATTRPLSPIFG